MLLIDAIYIHESGGKVLLEYLLSELISRKEPYSISLDERIHGKIAEELLGPFFFYSEPSEQARKKMYRLLSGDVHAVLCFANVPPPVQIKTIPVTIFFQNVLILSELTERNNYSFGQKLNFVLKKWYIRYRNHSQYNWIVQTPTMKKKLSVSLGVLQENIAILPFFADKMQNNSPGKQHNDKFLYPADGVPQKNHKILFKAWMLLADKYQLYPELHVTIPGRFHNLVAQIKELQGKGLKIVNHGVCTSEELDKLYHACSFLVFPSLAESLGLPMIEAANAGCSIVSADLPYVFDIVKPGHVFDPFGAGSMAGVITESMGSVRKTELLITNQVSQFIELVFHSKTH